MLRKSERSSRYLDVWSRSRPPGAPTYLRVQAHGCGTAPEFHRTSPGFERKYEVVLLTLVHGCRGSGTLGKARLGIGVQAHGSVYLTSVFGEAHLVNSQI